MPDIPDHVVRAAATAIGRHTAPRLRESPQQIAAAALGAAVPLLRELIAANIADQKTGCREHPMPFPKPSCWTCGRDGAFHRAALIAAGTWTPLQAAIEAEGPVD